MKPIIVACAVIAAGIGLASGAEPATMVPEAAAAWLGKTPTAQILDVRTTKEFATGHLSGALLIPWTDKDFKTRAAKELDPGKPILVYCRSGRRSAEAAAALAELRFTTIQNLEGGIIAWQKAGKPITKPE